MSETRLSFLDPRDGPHLAFRLREGAQPTLLFLPGYASDMEGSKAVALDAFAERRGLAMLRFDYSGTGSSKGGFEEGTLQRWLDGQGWPTERLGAQYDTDTQAHAILEQGWRAIAGTPFGSVSEPVTV